MTELEQTKQALADRTAELEQIKRVANELAAQVEQLRQLGAELINACGGISINAEIWSAASLAFGDVEKQKAVENLAAAINKSPAQCLAEVRAQAVEDLKEPLYKSGKADADIDDWLKEVAKIIRKQAKP